ncbi:MAG: hypothetical protein HN478_18740 [Rhodospirillaceae bacterium]|jgi:hypothetical protein|nr:hypothetical protein [Rhodospirillaceae bacterium]MBT5193860.1 hypothetical protein [Rhodospirillaceae bacterium]MBT5897438.1 hypothetical protein [Rhodospirillaceae bacterium]MBT6427482.1 hypothetical protein [Rhodospirillaceae bacterium]MBT7759489.1 hypothetical protein [Rhodospirillaceae bacterium]
MAEQKIWPGLRGWLARGTAICFFGLSLLAPSAIASEWDLGGYVASEIRLFPNSPGDKAQNSDIYSTALTLQPEFRARSASGTDQFVAIPFLKADQHDDHRSHGDLRELYWQRQGTNWSLLVGLNRVFWGVAEARHVVDIINQTDLVESPFAEDKLGQGMINLRYFADFGTFDGYFLTGFRDRSFPDDEARLRGGLPIDTDNPVFESSARRRHMDWALRWSRVIGDWDIGLSQFRGTGREPRLQPGLQANGMAHLVPHYDIINQTGLDIQYTHDAWIWKLEGFSRHGQGDRFLALAGGFEYTLFDLAGRGIDLGLLAEYLYDNRTADAPATHFDDDIFAGFRLALNDAAGTEVTGGAIIDRHSRAVLFSIEAAWRVNDRWRLNVEGLAFHRVPVRDPLYGVRRDDFLRLQLSRFF